MGQARYNGCGLRFIGMDTEPLARSMPTAMWDFSLTVMRGREGQGLFAVLKTEVHQVEVKDLGNPTGARPRKVLETWFQPEGDKAWKSDRNRIPGENGVASLTIYPVGGVMGSLMAAVENNGSAKFLLGIRLEGERGTSVYRFVPRVARPDGEAFMACAQALIDQSIKGANETGK